MSDFVTAIGLVMVIEGLLYAAAPDAARNMAAKVTEMPESTLRTIGVVVLCLGVGVVWLIRG
ncbi:MAG: DUF2065 domain-containing protein [Pseudomonadota bacterium]